MIVVLQTMLDWLLKQMFCDDYGGSVVAHTSSFLFVNLWIHIEVCIR